MNYRRRLSSGFLAIACSLGWAGQVDMPQQLLEASALSAERARIDEQYAQQKADCYGKFSVNDCLLNAKRTHQKATSDLRGQEADLDKRQRKSKGADTLQKSVEKMTRREVAPVVRSHSPKDGRLEGTPPPVKFQSGAKPEYEISDRAAQNEESRHDQSVKAMEKRNRLIREAEKRRSELNKKKISDPNSRDRSLPTPP